MLNSVPIDPSPKPSRRWGYRGTIALLLIVPVILGVDCARQWTPTHDEYWHLPLGLHALRTGDGQVDPINPPLVRMWAALPLWLQGVSSGEVRSSAIDAYAVGDAFQIAHPENHRELFFQSRLMMLPFGLLTGVVIVLWARRWWGNAAGMFAAVLWCGCPIMLAHAAIVAHDVPAMALTALTFYLAIKDREHPTAVGPWLLGAVMGLAWLTKFSTLTLIVLVPVFWLLLPSPSSRPWYRPVLGMLACCFTAWIVLHVGYVTDTFMAQRPNSLAPRTFGWLPGGFIAGLERLNAIIQVPHPVFLDGEWSLTGFRAYYLMGLLYELPLGFWVAVFVAAVLGWRSRRDRTELRRMAAIGMVVLAILIPASASGNQLGLRYVFPVIPLLIVFAASAARDWSSATTIRMGTVWGTGLLAIAALRFHPHHLSYFNELAGGPSRGVNHLVDSNLDWGQDLHSLRDYLHQHSSPKPLNLAYFGTASPSLLGIENQFPSSPQPQPGRYAISANFIAGRPHMLRDIDGRERQLALDELAPFRFFTPKAMMGYSIAYYEISPEDVARYHAAREKALRELSQH